MRKEVLVSLFLLAIFCATSVLAQNEKKTAYGLLLDNTGSLYTQSESVKKISKEIIRQVNQRGEVSIFNFVTKDVKPTLTVGMIVGVDWTQDEKSLNQYIDNLSVARGATTLIDAIHLAAEKVNSKVNLEKDTFSEKILIIVSDGEDRVSQTKPEELINFLKDSSIKVFAVGFLEGFEDNAALFPSRNSRNKSKKFLDKVTKETGGRVIFPKSKQTVEDIVKNLFSENKKESK